MSKILKQKLLTMVAVLVVGLMSGMLFASMASAGHGSLTLSHVGSV